MLRRYLGPPFPSSRHGPQSGPKGEGASCVNFLKLLFAQPSPGVVVVGGGETQFEKFLNQKAGQEPTREKDSGDRLIRLWGGQHQCLRCCLLRSNSGRVGPVAIKRPLETVHCLLITITDPEANSQRQSAVASACLIASWSAVLRLSNGEWERIPFPVIQRC